MSYEITLPQNAIRFTCEEDETVLDAARKAGYVLPASCRSGVCASCKGKILSGQAQTGRSSATLTEAEINDGFALFCQVRPESDLVLEAVEVRSLADEQLARLTAKIHKLERLADDVSLVQLRFPAGRRVAFRAGQYLQVLLDDGRRRNYSMANPSHQNDGVQLHIRHVPGGYFSGLLQSVLQRGDTLNIELPMGDFYLRDSELPLIFMVSGTGFAPVKSIIESMIRQKQMHRSVHLYWGGRRQHDIYMADLAQRWHEQFDNIKFIPVLSQEDNGAWRSGNVHEVVAQDFPDMRSLEVYACGSPLMIAAARQQFIQSHQLSSDHFYCDAFVTDPVIQPA